MKKRIALSITAFLAFASLSHTLLHSNYQPVSAAGGTAYASYGTPTIDADKDDRYDFSSVISLGAESTARCDVYALWDYDHVYVFSNIWDKTLSHIDNDVFDVTPWYSDSLEIFIDRTSSRSSNTNMPYGNVQLRVDLDNRLSGMCNGVIWAGKENNIESQVVTSAAKIWDDGTGYSIEIKIPLSIEYNGVTYAPTLNRGDDAADNRGSVGYDLMLNNAIDSSTRQDTYTWSAGVGAPAGWNTLRFMDEVPEELRTANIEKVFIPANSNIAAGAYAFSDTVCAFDKFLFYALDNNMETYSQGLSKFWSLTIDYRFEVEIEKIVVRTHADVYPTNFKVEYYNSKYSEWETVWDVENNPGVVMTLNIEDQIGQYFIDGPTITTRFVRFVPHTNVSNAQISYSYALYELQTFTPDRIQTVTRAATLDSPIDGTIPEPQGTVINNTPSDEIVDAPYSPKTVSLLSKTDTIMGWTILGLSISGLGIVLGICLFKHKKRKEIK
ncbi:MAG TPA: hypothetical protein GX010_01440 [Erysipelotrichaceae bacterium]|nr:hypothetical protein [Erysipelotrichaceae bacterium]